MTASTFDRLEIKVVRLPVWAAPLAAAVGIALVGLVGVLGFGLLLLISPIVLVAGVARFFKHRPPTVPTDLSDRAWPGPQKPARPAQPIVIDGEYEVVVSEDRSLWPSSNIEKK
ncbi:MAG: hypothetical protein ACKVP7_07675 [Hyphomicrobiaceae bacterium]